MTTMRWIEDADHQLLNPDHVIRVRPKLSRARPVDGQETWEVWADVRDLGPHTLVRGLDGRDAALAFIRQMVTGMDAETERMVSAVVGARGLR